jgi:hypothetical protein
MTKGCPEHESQERQGHLNMQLFFQQLFANRIGAFFGMDVFVSAVALLVFSRRDRVLEPRRKFFILVWVCPTNPNSPLPPRELQSR